MIVEGIVTTRDEFGRIHYAPMGVVIIHVKNRIVLRAFKSSETFLNLNREGCGVFHTTDDANLIAYAAVGAHRPVKGLREAKEVTGYLMSECCKAYEFFIVDEDIREDRALMAGDIVMVHHFRDFVGFNRAKHAILEAAIFATRFHMLDLDEVAKEFRKLRIIIDKTGTPDDLDTMTMLERKLAEASEA